ncbi:NUDIX domain-containing protein [Sphingobacteriales bacterium UPWRP_1]|nr:hypothetical protein BVG80_15295 [Sphingobacteriales bacterium TSM_CSM]PSJ79112.1 NUDIX domain-containing protein [Sphingobacteriales bacterium UPWRP_1]
MSKRFPFTVRVYGILINERHEVLLANEQVDDLFMTKFPGGGLEFGEGTREALAREFKEETDLDVTVSDHFYTTDFFVASVMDPSIQVMSIYYLVKTQGMVQLPPDTIQNNGRVVINFRWHPVKELHPNLLTFAIDKKVAEMLTLTYTKNYQLPPQT